MNLKIWEAWRPVYLQLCETISEGDKSAVPMGGQATRMLISPKYDCLLDIQATKSPQRRHIYLIYSK